MRRYLRPTAFAIALLIGAYSAASAQMRVDGWPSIVRIVTKILLPDGTAAEPSIANAGDEDTGIYFPTANNIGVSGSGSVFWLFNGADNVLTLGSGTYLTWASTTAATGSADVYVIRDAADTLAHRNGTTAQTHRWYETFTDTSNYERGEVVMGSDLMTIRTGTAGTGSDNQGIALTPSGTGYVTVTSRATAGTAPTVANVGANSCGTTAATLAGNDNAGAITVGTVSGTQCRITFSKAAPTRRHCTFSNETTANLARSTYVDASNTDLLGTLVGGDVVTYLCDAR